MDIKDLDKKYLKIWEKATVLLKKGRPDDYTHAQEVVKLIMDYDGELELDKDILIPAAMMHDIGHSAILPEDFRFVTGLQKISNAKLVHMLAGAKIAKEILESVGYDAKKSHEIVDIIRVHDADQLKDINLDKFYDTTNKKIFHDLDSLDRYTEARMKEFLVRNPDKKKLLQMLLGFIDNFFYSEFKEIAKERYKTLEESNDI